MEVKGNDLQSYRACRSEVSIYSVPMALLVREVPGPQEQLLLMILFNHMPSTKGYKMSLESPQTAAGSSKSASYYDYLLSYGDLQTPQSIAVPSFLFPKENFPHTS